MWSSATKTAREDRVCLLTSGKGGWSWDAYGCDFTIFPSASIGPPAFSSGFFEHKALNGEVDLYSAFDASFDFSTKEPWGKFGSVLELYLAKYPRFQKKPEPVESSIRFQLHGGHKALPMGATDTGKSFRGWKMYLEKGVTLPGKIKKVLTFVPKKSMCSATACKGSLDVMPFFDFVLGSGEILPTEYVVGAALGQTIVGDCVNGQVYPVKGETSLKKFDIAATKIPIHGHGGHGHGGHGSGGHGSGGHNTPAPKDD